MPQLELPSHTEIKKYFSTLDGLDVQLKKGAPITVTRKKVSAGELADLHAIGFWRQFCSLPRMVSQFTPRFGYRVADLGFAVRSEEQAHRLMQLGFNAAITNDEQSQEELRRAGVHVISRVEKIVWERLEIAQGQTRLDSALERLAQMEAGEVLVEFESSSGALAGHWDELLDGCREGQRLVLSDQTVWPQLAISPDSSGTAMYPRIEPADGGGLWPILSLERVDETIDRCRFHHFGGAIISVPFLPAEGSFFEGVLYATAHALWRAEAASLIFEEWNRERWKLSDEQLSHLKRGARLSERIEQFLASRAPEGQQEMIEQRTEGEALLAELNGLNLVSLKSVDLWRVFLRDSKKRLFFALQEKNITLPNVLTGDDMQPSFWAKMATGAGRGMATGGKVELVDELELEPDSELAELFSMQVFS